jgi:hypothetical protein
MPALAPYIPPKDAAFQNWFANFKTLINASPGTYGLMAGDATTINTSYTTWNAAYVLVTSPTTKTASTVSAKNTAKVNALAVIRPYAQQIANNAGVTSANKIALGLNPKTSTPSPITPPASTPQITLLSMVPGAVNLRFRDSAASPSVKAKPYGVKSLQLYGTHSATPITDPTLLPQIGTYTKSPLQWIPPGGYTPGQTWYFAAKWQTQKGLQSPYSTILSLVVA